MPLPSSGPLSLNDIQTEFGGTNPISLNEYYAGGANVPAGTTGTNGPVPSSGQISIANFYGTTKAALGLTYTYRGEITGEAFRANVVTLASNGSIYLAGGDTADFATSTNGIDWTYSSGLRNLPGWTTSDIRKIVWNGSVFLAGGGRGQLATSPDGITWTYISTLLSAWGSDINFIDAIWDGARWVVYGGNAGNDDFMVAFSSNLVTWTVRTAPVSSNYGIGGRIAYSGTIYVFTPGDNNNPGIVTSPDLTTFTRRTIGFDEEAAIGPIAWSGSAFLVASVDADLPEKGIFSSTNGTTWTNRTTTFTALTGGPSTIRDIYWSGTEFLISGTQSTDNGPSFATAPANGASFTVGVSVANRTAISAIKVGSRYIFGGTVGRFATSTTLLGSYTSDDISNSSPDTTYWVTDSVNAAAWNGSIYLIVGTRAVAATSPDGITWTYRLGLRSTGWGNIGSPLSIATNGSTFLVAGENGRVATTTDGVTWTYQGGLRSTAWGVIVGVASVIWTGSLYVAIGSDKYATSPDGVTWTYSATKFVRAATDTGQPNAMIWTGALLVVGTSDGHVYTSTNATTGTPDLASVAGDLGSLVKFNQFAWNGTVLVAATDNGIYTSTSPFTTWTQRITTLNIKSVVYNATAGQFVAVGFNGVSFYSTNGTSWSTGLLNSSPFGTTSAYRVTVNGGTQYVVAGARAQMATST